MTVGEKYDELLVMAALKEGVLVLDGPRTRRDDMERDLGICSISRLEHETADLVVVRATEGLGTWKSLYYVKKILLNGWLSASQVIVLAERREVVAVEERRDVEQKGFKPADTEYGMAVQAVHDIFGKKMSTVKGATHVGRSKDNDVTCRVRQHMVILYADLCVKILEIDSDPQRRIGRTMLDMQPNNKEMYLGLYQYLCPLPIEALSDLLVQRRRIYVVADDIRQRLELMRARKYLPSIFTVIGGGPRDKGRLYYSTGSTKQLRVRKKEELSAVMHEYYELCVGGG